MMIIPPATPDLRFKIFQNEKTFSLHYLQFNLYIFSCKKVVLKNLKRKKAKVWDGLSELVGS